MAEILDYKNMSEEEINELIAKIKAFSAADFVKAMNDNKEVFESAIKEMDSATESGNDKNLELNISVNVAKKG